MLHATANAIHLPTTYFGSQSKGRQNKTAKVKAATCLHSDKRHGHNGNKLKTAKSKTVTIFDSSSVSHS